LLFCENAAHLAEYRTQTSINKLAAITRNISVTRDHHNETQLCTYTV